METAMSPEALAAKLASGANEPSLVILDLNMPGVDVAVVLP